MVRRITLGRCRSAAGPHRWPDPWASSGCAADRSQSAQRRVESGLRSGHTDRRAGRNGFDKRGIGRPQRHEAACRCRHERSGPRALRVAAGSDCSCIATESRSAHRERSRQRGGFRMADALASDTDRALRAPLATGHSDTTRRRGSFAGESARAGRSLARPRGASGARDQSAAGGLRVGPVLRTPGQAGSGRAEPSRSKSGTQRATGQPGQADRACTERAGRSGASAAEQQYGRTRLRADSAKAPTGARRCRHRR